MQDDAEAEDLEDDFLGARLDPFALLQNMAAHNESVGTQAAIQPYEILAKQARQARQKAAPAKSPKRKAQDPLDGSSEVSISRLFCSFRLISLIIMAHMHVVYLENCDLCPRFEFDRQQTMLVSPVCPSYLLYG